MAIFESNPLFQTIILGIHVSFRGCNCAKQRLAVTEMKDESHTDFMTFLWDCCTPLKWWHEDKTHVSTDTKHPPKKTNIPPNQKYSLHFCTVIFFKSTYSNNIFNKSVNDKRTSNSTIQKNQVWIHKGRGKPFRWQAQARPWLCLVIWWRSWCNTWTPQIILLKMYYLRGL